MATVSLPALDWAAPIVDIRTGRPTPYLQRFWQNLKVTAVDGANQSGDISQLQTDVTTLNGQITTLNGQMAGKAPLASPVLTGNPTAPTPTAGDNDTSIATTAFVSTHAVARSTFTAWSSPTGTIARTTFATYTAPVISAAPTQAEVQAIANALEIVSRRLAAVITDLKT